MKLVSIIVPVYGVEQYLAQCVESLLKQTYQNLEIILVDDGGKDNCPVMCDCFASQDSRVVSIHKENQGQSYARRDGLARSTGEYVMFVDADDWMELETVEAAVNKAEETNVDIVMFGYKRIHTTRTFETKLFDENRIFEKREMVDLQRRLVGLYGDELNHVEAADRISPMWGKLYKREVALAGEWYSEREVGSSEDALFNLHAFSLCRKCAYLDRPLYCYRKTNENATTAKYRANLVKQWIKLFGCFERYILDNGLDETFCVALRNRIALSILGIGLNELTSPDKLREKAKKLRTVLTDTMWVESYSCLKYDALPLKWKVFFFFCKYKLAIPLLFMLYAIRKLKSVVPQ